MIDDRLTVSLMRSFIEHKCNEAKACSSENKGMRAMERMIMINSLNIFAIVISNCCYSKIVEYFLTIKDVISLYIINGVEIGLDIVHVKVKWKFSLKGKKIQFFFCILFRHPF